mgnify:CR=1 FL=1
MTGLCSIVTVILQSIDTFNLSGAINPILWSFFIVLNLIAKWILLRFALFMLALGSLALFSYYSKILHLYSIRGHYNSWVSIIIGLYVRGCVDMTFFIQYIASHWLALKESNSLFIAFIHWDLSQCVLEGSWVTCDVSAIVILFRVI